MSFEMKALHTETVRKIIGLPPSGVAYVLAQSVLSEIVKGRESILEFVKPTLVVVPNVEMAESLSADLRFFLPPTDADTKTKVCCLSSWEILPFDTLSPTTSVSATRIDTLYQLSQGRAVIVVATVEALMQKLVQPSTFKKYTAEIELAADLDRDEFVDLLDRLGYSRSTIVEEIGQMAVRGAVVDFFPPGVDAPIRLELFGDIVESIRTFDPNSQRSLQEVERIQVLPAREFFCAPMFSNQTPEKGAIDSSITKRLRDRVSELGLPQGVVKQIENALIERLNLPGIEHLQPLFLEQSALLWDYFTSEPSIIVCNKRSVTAAAEDFSALVEERAELSKREGLLFPEPAQAYISAAEFLDRVNQSLEIIFDEVSILGAEELGVADIEKSGGIHQLESIRTVSADSSVAESSKLPIFTLSKLQDKLRAAKHQELPFLPLAEEIIEQSSRGVKVGIVVSHPSRIKRFQDLMASYDIIAESDSRLFPAWYGELSSLAATGKQIVSILSGQLSVGIKITQEKFILIPDHEIFPDITSRRSDTNKRSIRRFIGSVSQLKENDFIVHIDHGIGIYRGLRQLTIEGKVGDFLALEYADEAKLFLPVENIGKIQKYAAAEGKKPALSKLGGKTWATTKSKVKENVAELAGQLLKVIAEREMAVGASFGEFDSEDRGFADSFPFEETPDQSKAIADVLADLCSGKPMDRLVCGDVGYGKTEVALRAAFKAVSAGKQVAVLVPTTVLADQHFATFKARFADTAVKVSCVSRFQTAQENKAVLADLENGNVDIVIGTHRLLQKDVFFKDLGLIIIDEEHRFGVAHKEKLKRLRAEVHILTLTATPIPRTLHMSLTGIRDLSVIETPPCNRQVIRTYLATYSEQIVKEAILRELGRNGQVFYINNRVENIALITDEVRELVPSARVAFGHGQMKEGELEVVMHKFVSKEIDVLVSTTIVESGLDIPNANTIIIRNADRFGLAELYQLRGRVGRSSRRAYAYLLIPDPKTLGADARKRLQVLQALDDLGVGFRLALQDMEIRGAGNLLGKDQSGHIGLVGFELYSRILKEAVNELRAKKASNQAEPQRELPAVDPEVSIGFPAHIPPDYIPDVAERLILYQRLIELRDEEDGRQIAEEIEDRFGQTPKEVVLLLELMVFRSLLRRSGIVSAKFRGGVLSVSFHPQAVPDVKLVVAALSKYKDWLRVSPGNAILINIAESEVESPGDLGRVLERVLKELGVV